MIGCLNIERIWSAIETTLYSWSSLILTHCDFEPLGVPFHDVVIFGLEPDFLFKSILALQLYSIYDFCFQVPEDPFFFCNDCFRQFNYSPKNEKVGNFKAYPFIDVNALWSDSNLNTLQRIAD